MEFVQTLQSLQRRSEIQSFSPVVGEPELLQTVIELANEFNTEPLNIAIAKLPQFKLAQFAGRQYVAHPLRHSKAALHGVKLRKGHCSFADLTCPGKR